MPSFLIKALSGAGLAMLAIPAAMATDPERNGPSFDCHRASSAVEKAICASPALSSLDGQIGMRYSTLRKGLDKISAEKLKLDQQWFIQSRNESFAASSETDRVDVLRDRLTFLNRISWSTPAGIEGRWRNNAGEIILSRNASGHMTFSGNAAEPVSGRWVCDMNGDVRSAGAARWTVNANDATGGLELSRSGQTLQVAELGGGSGASCGLNGTLGGNYFRIGSAR